jgi:S-adenosylmethionine decarboxylase
MANLVDVSVASPLFATLLETQPADHFIRQDGVEFAGNHVLIDLWGASRLNDLKHMESVLRKAIEICGATLLHIHLHHFAPTGISGVAVLAESHISVHTWPERGFAAFDVFMCGDAEPQLAVPLFREAFLAERVEVNNLRRGLVSELTE